MAATPPMGCALGKLGTAAGPRCPAGVWKSSPRLGSWLCHRHVGPSTQSALSGAPPPRLKNGPGTRQLRHDPEGHTTRPSESGRQGPILFTPVSPNLDPLMNSCPVNEVFTRGSQSWLELANQKAHIHLVIRICQALGPLWPSFYLLKAGGHRPLPSGPRLQILDILHLSTKVTQTCCYRTPKLSLKPQPPV